jgi:DNA-binding GntR family transcriptional regulator
MKRRRRRLGASARLVCMAIANRMTRDGEASPAYRVIAEDTGMSRVSAIRAVAKLVEGGMIEVERGGGRMSNRYRLSAAAKILAQQASAS